MRICPSSDRFWWIVAAGYLAVLAVLGLPGVRSDPLERGLDALLLGGPAILLARRLRHSPGGVRVTLHAGFTGLALGLALDVASTVPALSSWPLVAPGVAGSALALGFFLVLVSCLRLLETGRREREELERSRAEASRSSERYRELFAGMRDAVFESDVSGRFLSINPAGLELLGYASLEGIRTIDIPTQLYVDPGDRERLHERVLGEGFVRDFETRLRCRDGSIIHALVNSTAQFGLDGRVELYRGTIRDVTAQRRAQAEIARLQELNRNVIESLSQGLFVVDRNLRTIRANRGLERITHVARDRLLGSTPWEALPDLPELEARLRHALAGTTTTRDRVAMPREDGTVSHLSDTYSPLRDARGEIVGVLGFVEEVTERILLEQQLIQAEKVAAIGQMISGIAHEINNPLTAVSGYAQLLLTSDLEPEIRTDVEKIAQSAERCGQIVRGLLTYGRKHEHRLTAVDPVEVLDETRELRAYELGVEDIRIEREDAPNLPLVHGDRFQLQQVVLNLIHNAADAIRERGGPGLIRLSARQEGDRVVLGVFNDGNPIPEDVIHRIFDPFFTTKEVGRGTGLGLSVAQNIVRNHGGSLRVRNEADGVRFDLDLPAFTTAEPEAETIVGTGAAPADLERVRILVVDDEESIQDLFSSALPDADVVCAPDGTAALGRLEAEHWDAVISDLKMPGGVSGIDIVEWARRHRPTLVPRMVIMTGAALDDALHRRLPDDVPVLLKPFGLDDLRSCVAGAVQGACVDAALR